MRLLIIPVATLLAVGSALDVETLTSIGALPAHIAGSFRDLTICQQTRDGEYFVFDRRAHAVFSAAKGSSAAREIVRIGAEAGRVLRPSAFDLAEDGSFVVADSPGDRGRIQVFLLGGASIGGFTLATRETPTLTFDGVVTTGIASIEYTGRSLLISQPEAGALISEYTLDGKIVRTFGTLRPTGHESDRDVHLALNAGLPIVNPKGGVYFVFLAGTPLFRKYDAAGTLVFERHIEGIETDDYIRSIPTSWPRRRSPDGDDHPLVNPGIRTAAADPDGNLWISLGTPFTYVYDGNGDKRRTIQFRAAGIIAPRSMYFTHDNRVLVTPGCYAFAASPATPPSR
jgi:hypothetical protein